jgi:type IV pilus assembly protein PilY1
MSNPSIKQLMAPAAFTLAAVASWSCSIVLAAEPAQIPLTSRVSEPPPANVLLTIDDSGSMLADFMPEGNFTLPTWPTKTLNLGNGWVGGFPGDARKLNGESPTGNYLDGVVTGLKGNETVYQMQYRSPDVNAIYYNPDLRYSPWFKSDGSGNRMSDASTTATRWDPVVSAATFQLNKNYTGGSKIQTIWYTGPGTKASNPRDFYPGLVYRLKSGADPTLTASFTRYDINATDGTHAPSVKHPNRTDCIGTSCTQAEELQNFANWFSYYRMRESLTKASVSETLVPMKDKIRLGWARINKTNSEKIDGVSFTRIENETNGGPMRQLDATRLAKVLGGVQQISSWPSTPLRISLNEIGRYFDVSQRGTAGSPWLTNPADTNSSKLACRRSVHLMMTDGYYNDSYTKTGNADNSNGPDYSGPNDDPYGYLPAQYVAQKPYNDAYSDTLADIAASYFKKDLDPSIANKVAPVSGDIAFWQHLTQYMVGLGVKGTLDTSTPAAKQLTLEKIKSGALAWPNPCSSCTAEKIDDMWHASVNSGGDFYSAANVTDLTSALQSALGKAAGNEAKEAGVATASATIVANNVKYVPKYKSVSWYGDLEAWALNANGETEGDTAKWKASENLPAQDKRNLYTWSSKDSVAFQWASMDSNTQNLIGSEDLTKYIRGDASLESGAGKKFRSRAGQLLGDFVNSPPVVVQGLVDLGYTAINASYADFVAAKKSRTDSAIFVGGNDGILHAFRGSTGAEVYGYLPRAGLSSLRTIAAVDYGTKTNFHHFFVDGPVSETDAFISVNGAGVAWANLLLGSMGAGGKAFFAVHVPTTDPTSLGAKSLMWENSGADDGDIGYMFADFAVGKVKGGGWKAFVGNGVYSNSGNAVLLVVDVATGKIEKKITVENSGSNGLMGVSLVKDDTTKEVVAAYAGDLKGNLWRFDFATGSPSDWNVGFKGQPLFRATDASGNAQPITVPPVFVNHSIKGRVVLFGTGRLIDSGDADSAAMQSYYGVWDQVKVGESALNEVSPFDAIGLDRSALQLNTVSTTPKNTKTGIYYEILTTPVDWEKQLGWMFDLPFARQRVIYPSVILGVDYVLLSTVVPAPVAAECESTNGLGYNYILAAQDGTQLDEPIFDTDGDGDVDSNDEIASGYQSSSDGRDAIVSDPSRQLQDGESGGEGLICNTENVCKRVDLPNKNECDPNKQDCGCPLGQTCDGGGSISIKDRIWKQIVNPPAPAKGK